MKVYIVKPYGVCNGVKNAIDSAVNCKVKHSNEKVTILGMLVHNEEITRQLKNFNIDTIIEPSLEKGLDNINQGYVIFTAHGHDQKLNDKVISKDLKYLDCTCPQVQKVFDQIQELINQNQEIIYIGKQGHPETVGALSISPKIKLFDKMEDFDFSKLETKSPFVINQTTLPLNELKTSQDFIKDKIPDATIINTLCAVTKARQIAVLNMPKDIDFVYVVGSHTSANTESLYQLVKKTLPNAKVKKIVTIKDIDDSDLITHKYIGIVSGASTPTHTVELIIEHVEAIK